MLTTKERSADQLSFVNLKSPRNEEPYFVQSVKDGDKWKDADERHNTITGVLVAVDHKTYEWEGKKKDKVKMEFDSPEGLFVVEASMTSLTRAIINNIAAAELDGLRDIEIQVYSNKKGYPSASVWEGGESLDWKYSSDDYPAAVITPLPDGTEHKSYKAMNDFFINVLLNEIGPKLPKRTGAPGSGANTTPPASATKPVNAETSDDGDPFDDLPDGF